MPAARQHSVPAAVYRLVERTPGAILLEGSSNNSRNEEPWTQLFTAPLRFCTAYEPEQVPALFAGIEDAVAEGLTAAGFFTYECGAAFEPKAGMRPARPGMRLAWFGLYERGWRFDHATGAFADGGPPELANSSATEADPAQQTTIEAEFGLDEASYAQRIATIHEWIRRGDVYQLNLTAPWRVKSCGDAAALYARLRGRQPAEYGAFLHWQAGRHILSFSPELFFRVDREGATRRMVTRPMKGTAPRGRTTAEDRSIAEWLRNDEKNRSENLMIVDLLRNDLGRVARTGSVRAERLFEVERLPTLWQMTSTVAAELRGDVQFRDLFRALFPCGSITGAPKVRAMQLIGAVEDEPRGVYTGAIGFFSPQQTVFNVAIRTLELENGGGRMGTGGGIVIDSRAAAEYRECLLKAEFLTRSTSPEAEEFSLIETLRWENGYPLLALHLDRLTDSADYFDFVCERGQVQAALEAYAARFAPGAARRVRLLLSREGTTEITDAPLPAGRADEALRVALAQERTDPEDRMLFHKTTHRRIYERAFEAATRAGLADVLFFNVRGELTEGAISSVFVEKNGRWATPPLECGLLPSVYRRHLLETRSEIEERVLREKDVCEADAVYLANAVRGLRRVVVE